MMCSEMSKLTLERYFVGELTNDEALRVKAHRETCPTCNSKLAEMESQKEVFLISHPYRDIEHRLTRKQPWFAELFNKKLLAGAVPALALLIVLFIAGPEVLIQFQKKQSDVSFKGSSILSFMYRRDGKVMAGKESDVLQKDDEVQIVFSSPKASYFTLASIDSRGTVSLYGPDSQSPYGSLAISAGSNQYFPYGIALDDAAGFEIFVALFSSSPVQKLRIEKALQNISKPITAQHIADTLKKEFDEEAHEVATLVIKKK